MIVLCGTYQKILCGYSLLCTDPAGSSAILQLAFNTDPEVGTIKCIASGSSKKYVACSGTGTGIDNQIALLSLGPSKHQQLGILQIEGTANCLAWAGNSLLLAGLSTGALGFWGGMAGSGRKGDCSNWDLRKILPKAHKGEIAALAVHPSNSLCLSVGAKDWKLKVWDLTSATMAHQIRLEASPINFKWNKTGTLFAVLFEQKITCYFLDAEANKGEPIKVEGEAGMKFCSFDWMHCDASDGNGGEGQKDSLIVGLENGHLAKVELSIGGGGGGKLTTQLAQAHSGRVKGIKVLEKEHAEKFVTICTDGTLTLWQWKDQKKEEFLALDSHETGYRFLSLEVFQ